MEINLKILTTNCLTEFLISFQPSKQNEQFKQILTVLVILCSVNREIEFFNSDKHLKTSDSSLQHKTQYFLLLFSGVQLDLFVLYKSII